MLRAIVRFSLRFSGAVIALACILAGYGLYRLMQAKYDVFPEFAPPQVVIQTEAPGLAPKQVEALVTQPIENIVNGVPGIRSLRSSSIQGLSVIKITFHSGGGIYRDRQVVAERLSTIAGKMPQGVKAPVMTPLTSSTSIVLVAGLTSSKVSPMKLRTIADWTVKQRLMAIAGVAKVAVFGGGVRQLQIQVRPDQMIKYNLGIEDVVAAARRSTGIKGAGFIENRNQRIVLQTEGQSITPQQFAGTVILRHKGVNVTLGDVANVTEAPEPPIGAASVMGHNGILLMISAQYGANTLEVTQKIEQALRGIEPALRKQGITLYPDIFRSANFIHAALDNISLSLMAGGMLVIIVLFLFLFNFRTAAISITAIPLSLLAATAVLEQLGFSLNTMTLGGLAIAIGEVVDDAIIDMENILRRITENRRLENPRPVPMVVLDASMEVRGAVVYATFAVIMVFVPVLTMTGVAGRLFSPLGVSYITAVMASLLTALTVTPVLCLLMLGRGKLEEKDPPVMRWLKAGYRSLLLRVEGRPGIVIGSVALLTVTGLAALPFLGGGFLPELQEGHFIVHMSAVPGTSLQESMRLGRQVTLALLKIPSVRSVAQRAGRAEEGDDVMGPQDSEFEVDLKPLSGRQAESVRMEIQRRLAQFPGVDFAIKTFLTERIEETISGYTASVVINIFGNDLGLLDTKAKEIARILGGIKGAADVKVQSRSGTPQLIVNLKKDSLARWGFSPADVLSAVQTAYQGEVVGQIYDGGRVFDVSVILDPKDREDIAGVGALPLRNAEGTYVSLGRLADIHETSGRYVILHQGARRLQTVTCDVAGGDVNSFVKEAKKAINSHVFLPAGMYVEFGGAAAAQAQSRHDLIVHSLMAFAGVVILLTIIMKNMRNSLLVLVNLPFALAGGVFAVFVSGGILSIGTLVGFVTLFGITLRNSIMMISHYEHLISVEGMDWGLEAAIRGASERLAPILMTASVTALGLLPLAIGSGAPGREIEGPMAIVILGGLVTSTTLNILVLPALALRYGRFENIQMNGGISAQT